MATSVTEGAGSLLSILAGMCVGMLQGAAAGGAVGTIALVVAGGQIGRAVVHFLSY